MTTVYRKDGARAALNKTRYELLECNKRPVQTESCWAEKLQQKKL